MPTPSESLSVLAAATFLLGGLRGQAQVEPPRALPGTTLFAERRLDPLPDTTQESPAITLQDVDGDGDLDLVGADLLQLNDGHGVFLSVPMPATPGRPMAVVTGDVDGDGHLDLVLGLAQAQPPLTSPTTMLFLGDGRGGFTDVTATHLSRTPDATSALALGDIDGDGDLDLITGHVTTLQAGGAQNRVSINLGNGRFALSPSSLPRDVDLTTAMRLVDIDGDQDLDLVVANGSATVPGPTRLYLNNGLGSFSSTVQPLAPVAAPGLVVGDVDGDGDPDLIVYSGSTPDPVNRHLLYINDGRGGFTDQSPLAPWKNDRISALALVDLDQDRDLDVVVAVVAPPDARRFTYRNDGGLKFTDVTPAEFGRSSAGVWSFLTGDVDRDGYPDVVSVTGRYGNELHVNARGALRAANPPSFPVVGLRASVCFDADGDLDLDILRPYLHGHQLLRNDGVGGFEPEPVVWSLSQGATVLAAGDVDGDGDVDVVATSSLRPAALLLNDGKGRFRDSDIAALPGGVHGSRVVLLEDVDGDGDLDLFLGNQSQNSRGQDLLYLNDGTGRFRDVTVTQLPVDNTTTLHAVALDVEGDGDRDLVLVKSAGLALYRNDGSGGFSDVSAGQLPTDTRSYSEAAAVDIDGDRDPDLILIEEYPVPGVRIYTNDGRGTFAMANGRTPTLPGYVFGRAFVDMDGDGAVDILLSSTERPTLGLDPTRFFCWRNDRSGRFTDVSTRSWPQQGHPVFGMTAVDVDLDGDVDILTQAQGRERDRLFVNRLRHLSPSTIPRIGRRYELEIFSQAGFATGPQTALLYLSSSRLSPLERTAFGIFGVGPTGAVNVVLYGFTAPEGSVSWSASIPVLPALEGVVVYGQALVLPTSTGVNWRFTQLHAARIGY